MINQAVNKHKPRPYTAENYNVIPLYAHQLKNMDNFLARVINSFVEKLNDNLDYHLPRYLVVMLDKDLIEAAKVYDYGVSRTLEDTLKWLLININQCIELRKSDLTKKRMGTVSSKSEPRILWVAMVPRPVSANKQTFSLTRKFNNILEEVISGDKRSHIMKIHIDHDNGFFDRTGNLTPDGFIAFWRTFDSIMHDFEIGETNLSPVIRSKHPDVQPNCRPESHCDEGCRYHHHHENFNNHSSNHFVHKNPYKWTRKY